jgi:hypothetical protein
MNSDGVTTGDPTASASDRRETKLNLLLTYAVKEEVLKIQDKSYDVSCSCPPGAD